MPTLRHVGLALAVVGVLAIYAVVAYPHAILRPFLGDDYVILDKVRDRDFWALWLPDQLFFHWYRPWSREVHYWALHRVAGLRESSYHAASFGLWIAVMSAYFLLVMRLAGVRAASVATAGVAALGLWSGPLLWVAGAQDLWMLLFGLLMLHAVAGGRTLLAVPALLLALLSKETAAVLPAVATAYRLLIRRDPIRSAISKTWALWAALVGWLVLHPTLRDRMLGRLPESFEAANRLSAPTMLVKTLLAQANLEDAFSPEVGWLAVLGRGALGATVLVTLLLVGRHAGAQRSEGDPSPEVRSRVARFGLAWAVSGWTVLFLPSIGWHAYYGVLGSLGIWLAIAPWLVMHARVMVPVVIALALLREGRAATPSWDWGTEWYQTRAAALLSSIRERLTGLHPSVPAHSRLYFARIPNSIGFLAGDGPAIRIWYDDPTLRANFYSAYALRTPNDTLGEDFFFRFDTVRVLVEITTDPEQPREAMADNPVWQHDHEVLASMFIGAGNLTGAATEYAKLSSAFPDRPDYALYASAAHQASGRSEAARGFARIAARAFGDSVVRVRTRELIRALPSQSARRDSD